MADRNDEIRGLFAELAELSVLEDQNPQSFRARAYDRARHALEGVSVDLASLSVAQLQRIDGIGKSTAKRIREYLDTGRIARLEELREAFPPSVVEVSRVPGVGPKTLARMRDLLGITDLQGLQQAIDDQQLRTLEGLGEKSEANIARSLARLGLTAGKHKRTPIASAMALADRLVGELMELPSVQRAVPCGSLRRHAETVGDLDIVVASDEPAPIMAWFAAHPLATEVLLTGDKKTSIVTHHGLQIDLRVVSLSQMGAATMYFTGSKAHNIRLRQLAMARGWILNEYALAHAETGEVVASETEAEIYRALDLPYIEPPMREDTGEVEAGQQGVLPEALQAEDLLGDLHVHTDRSGDARSSLPEIVAEASRRGYAYLAVTDHAEDLPINGVSKDELLRQADEMAALQVDYPGLRLLRGCELNIGADGGLDYDPEFRQGLDWCIAAVHNHFDLPQAEQTRRLIRAIGDPCVRVIGHLTGRMIGRRPGIDIDVDAVLDALVETGVALEINSALPRLDAAAPVLRAAVAKGVTFVVGTDSHHVREMSRNAPFGARQAQRGWVPRDRVANTWGADRFGAWLDRQRTEGQLTG